MILSLWLDLPVWLIFATLAGVFAVAAGLLVALTNLSRTRPTILCLGLGLVPTYFTAISVMLSLLTGFVANDAWERHRQAARVVQNERSNLLAIHDLSLATVSDMREIRTALLTYADALITDEWPKMTDGTSSSQAGAALGQRLCLITPAGRRLSVAAANVVRVVAAAPLTVDGCCDLESLCHDPPLRLTLGQDARRVVAGDVLPMNLADCRCQPFAVARHIEALGVLVCQHLGRLHILNLAALSVEPARKFGVWLVAVVWWVDTCPRRRLILGDPCQQELG